MNPISLQAHAAAVVFNESGQKQENPFPQGTQEAQFWQREFERFLLLVSATSCEHSNHPVTE